MAPFTIADPDAGEAAFRPQTATTSTPAASPCPAPAREHYDINNALPAVQALKEGESKTGPRPERGWPRATVTLTVLGTNDGPVANPDAAAPTTSRSPSRCSATTDPDSDPLTVTGATVDAAEGSVTVNPDGTLTFTPAANVNGPVTVTYTIADGKGGTSTATATIDITPTATPPSSAPAPARSRTPTQTSAGGHLSHHRPGRWRSRLPPADRRRRRHVRGSFSVSSAGAWTYDINNALPAVQALKEGESKTEVFTVQSVDRTSTTVTLTVLGTNDGPVANPDTASTDEDKPVTFAVLGNDTDPDSDPLHTVHRAPVDPAKGWVTVNPDGTLTFTPAANVNGPVTVTYTLSDGHGGVTTGTATVVRAEPDTAVLSAGTGSVKEDTPAQTSAGGTLTVANPDAGEAAFRPADRHGGLRPVRHRRGRGVNVRPRQHPARRPGPEGG